MRQFVVLVIYLALALSLALTMGFRALANTTDVFVSAFEREGYFEGAEVSPLEPRLLLIAPALRIHPANETVLRFLSPNACDSRRLLSQNCAARGSSMR